MAADTCRLCLRPIDKAKSSNLLTETTKLAMLKEFLPDMNLDISENTEVCNNCMGELETSYNYKNGVVANEANIQAKLKGKKQKKIDLKLMLDGVAKKELKKGDHICRTCLSICKSPSISLFDSPSNMMPYSFVKEMCEAVFELEFIASAKPVLCDDCWETLQTVYNFRKSCLRIDQRLRTYVASKNVKKLSIDEFKKFAEENPVKEEDEDSSDEEINGYIKDEPIDEEELKIDPEEASCSSSSVKVKDETEVKSESELNSDDEDMEDEPDLLDPKALKSEASEPDGEDCKMEIGDVKVDTEGEGAAGTSGELRNFYNNPDHSKGQCERLQQISFYETNQKNIADSEKVELNIEQNKSVTHLASRASCTHSYKTRCKSALKKYELIHQADSTVQMLKCAQCSYRTKFKSSLKRHSLIHQSYDTVQMFSCTQCSYKSNYQSNLKQHTLANHSDDSIQMFSCTQCNYKSKFKYYLRRHELSHRSGEAVQMFGCMECSYKSRYQTGLRQHVLSHHSRNTARMFSCAQCSYKYNHKSSLKKHTLAYHSSKAKMFQCTQCSYKSKHKTYLKLHEIVHRSGDAVQMFSCGQCSYKTKYKRNLKQHGLVHLSGDTVEVFRCAQCSYKSKYKHHLRQHLLTMHIDS